MKRTLTALILTLLLALGATATPPLHVDTRINDTAFSLRDTTVLFPVDSLTVRLVAASRAATHGSGSWGLVWGDWPRTYYRATIAPTVDLLGDPVLAINVTRCSGTETLEPLGSITLYRDVALRRGALNSLELIAEPLSGLTQLYVGNRDLTRVFDTTLPYPDGLRTWGIFGNGRLDIEAALTEIAADISDAFLTPWTDDTLDRRFATTSDPLEGYWEMLDCDTDPALALAGGTYRVAIVAADGGYDILYLAGATVNASDWRPFMRRGHLTTTQFVDHYDLVWTDASFETIDTDIHATLDQGTLLTLNFPLYRSRLRFRHK